MTERESQQEIRGDFSLDSFLKGDMKKSPIGEKRESISFQELCKKVKTAFGEDWESADEALKESKLEREKDAIIGKEYAVDFYKEKIAEILREEGLENVDFPKFYAGLEDGIFHENWGLAGLAPWAYDATEKYKKSSSAKIIGDRVYCLIDGKLKLQQQKISKERRMQLKKALLLATPKERLEEGFHEVYMHNGIRITIFSGDRTKEDQDVMVFRKYVLNTLTLEKMAEVETIPREAIPLFKNMIKVGFNVIFSGQVRSGKTTFLQTWQSYEDDSLEGLAIATDPETPWHRIMPTAPIMQIIADGKELEQVTKSLLRGDNDYVLLEEMRDATAFNIALDITSTGTMRSKGTIHANNPMSIPYKMASKISTKYGGDLNTTIANIYGNFNYIFDFFQVPWDKSKKKLKSIYELEYDPASDKCSAHKICQYSGKKNSWEWRRHLGADKERIGEGMQKEINRIKGELEKLEKQWPIKGATEIVPAYYRRAGEKKSD